jgi:hypothetical protein
MNMRRCAVALVLCSATVSFAQDRATLDRSQIIGNRELPKVLYIVPWKKPEIPDVSTRPTGGVLEEALMPIDRDIFRRQLRYDAGTQARAAANGTPGNAPAPAAQ